MAKQKITYEPQVLDLTLYAGDGAKFRLVVANKDGVPEDLTGTMIAQVRASREDADPPNAEFTVDLTDHATGIAVVEMSGADTHSLISGDEKFEGVWDLQWTPSGDQPRTLCQGKVECLPDVSH